MSIKNLIKKVKLFLRAHPAISSIGALLIGIGAVWQLFSNKPLIPTILKWIVPVWNKIQIISAQVLDKIKLTHLLILLCLYLLWIIYQQRRQPLTAEEIDSNKLKGYLDYRIEGDKASKLFIKAINNAAVLMGRHGAFMKRMTPKIQKAKKGNPMSRLIWQSEALRARRISRKTARFTKKIAKKMGKVSAEIRLFGKTFTDNYIQFLEWATTEGQKQDFSELTSAIKLHKSNIPAAINSIREFINSLSNLRPEGRLIEANNRLEIGNEINRWGVTRI